MPLSNQDMGKWARDIRSYLFRDGTGKEYAHLSLDSGGKIGWGQGAVSCYIYDYLVSASAGINSEVNKLRADNKALEREVKMLSAKLKELEGQVHPPVVSVDHEDRVL